MTIYDFSVSSNVSMFLPPVRYAPPVTDHVPLHSKSSCKNMARASGGAHNMHPLSWGGGGGGHKRKRSQTLFYNQR